MATLRNKRKLAAVTRESQEENPRNGQSRNTSVPRINEEYITQVSEEIEGRITKKLSQEFNRIESRISDALSKLDEFLSNQQIQTHSKTVPGTFRNTNVENQGTNEDDSQSDPHPEVGPSVCQSRHPSDSDTSEAHDTMTGVIEQTTKGPHTIRDFLNVILCNCARKIVAVVFWASVSCRLAVEETRFRMRIILGVVLIRSLVISQYAPGGLRSGSGVPR